MLAIDGDTGIDTEICYRLEFELEKDCEYMKLNHDSLTYFLEF